MKKWAMLFLTGVLAVLPTFAQDKTSQQLTLTVKPAALAITNTTLPGAMVGLAYTGSVSVTGGITPYTFNVSVGTLPAGIVLSSTTGALSGTPTTSGTSNFTIQVTDSQAPTVSVSQVYTITVVPTLTITTTLLAPANIGVAYTATITVTGGVSPYTFAVTTGSLPSGITLNPATGLLSGTPTVAGTFTFTITVTDSATNITKVLGKAIIVASGPQPKKVRS